MKIYLNCTANLGDFMNAYPVLAGLAADKKIDLVIRHEMQKFLHFRELLYYQDIFNSINYDNEVSTHGHYILSSWTRMDRNDSQRPIETCRYENWLRDNYQIDFVVDDNCILQIPEIDVDVSHDLVIVGDRWGFEQDHTVDTRRYSNVIRNAANLDPNKVHYLDYTRSIFENCAIIKNNPNWFVTTFTGIGIIADLMNKPTIVCWDEDMRIWDGQPVEFDWHRHYYNNRQSKLCYVKDLNINDCKH